MFKRRLRNAKLFQARLRSERSIVYGGQVWAYAVLALLLAALTSPLWLIWPPKAMGDPQEIRLAGASFWSAVAILGIFAGRSWGLRIALHFEDKIVSRERCSPWRVETIWSHPGDRVSYVTLTVNAEGVARLEAWLKDGSALLLERGVNQSDLQMLGKDLASCWGVPFRSS